MALLSGKNIDKPKLKHFFFAIATNLLPHQCRHYPHQILYGEKDMKAEVAVILHLDSMVVGKEVALHLEFVF